MKARWLMGWFGRRVDRMREQERSKVRREVVQSLGPCLPGTDCCPDEDEASHRDLAEMMTRDERLSAQLQARRKMS